MKYKITLNVLGVTKVVELDQEKLEEDFQRSMDEIPLLFVLPSELKDAISKGQLVAKDSMGLPVDGYYILPPEETITISLP